jgi:hypothetical protein
MLNLIQNNNNNKKFQIQNMPHIYPNANQTFIKKKSRKNQEKNHRGFQTKMEQGTRSNKKISLDSKTNFEQTKRRNQPSPKTDHAKETTKQQLSNRPEPDQTR